MSIDKLEIIEKLRAGDTIDDIAAELTGALNDAKAAYEKEEAERKEKEAELAAKAARETKRENEKKHAAEGMLDYMCDYAVAIGDDELLNELHDITADELVNIIDETVRMAKSLKKISELEFPLRKDGHKDLVDLFKELFD